jgi:hypothetical protein
MNQSLEATIDIKIKRSNTVYQIMLLDASTTFARMDLMYLRILQYQVPSAGGLSDLIALSLWLMGDPPTVTLLRKESPRSQTLTQH